MTLRASDDRTRVVNDAPVAAIAAYEGTTGEDGFFQGHHVGVFFKITDAESWLETGEPKPIPIFEPEGPMPRPESVKR